MKRPTRDYILKSCFVFEKKLKKNILIFTGGQDQPMRPNTFTMRPNTFTMRPNTFTMREKVHYLKRK